LHDIAEDHCTSIANGAVAFGHDGFHDRMQKAINIGAKFYAENCARNYNYEDSVRAAIEGWVDSNLNHNRQILLLDCNMCGIAVHCK